MIRVLFMAVLTAAEFGSLACGAQTVERPSVAKPDRYTIGESDPEGGSLSFMVNAVPAGLSFDNATGTLSGMPASAGSAAIMLTGTEIFGASVQDSFTITINDPLVTGKKGGGGSLNGLVNRLFVLLLFVLAGIRRYNASAQV